MDPPDRATVNRPRCLTAALRARKFLAAPWKIVGESAEIRISRVVMGLDGLTDPILGPRNGGTEKGNLIVGDDADRDRFQSGCMRPLARRPA